MRLHRYTIVLAMACTIGLLAACGGGQAAPTPAPTAAPQQTPTAPAEAGFQQEWDALIAAARAEGELQGFFCCSSGVEMPRELLPAFEREFGIRVVASTGFSGQQIDRTVAERQAGRYTLDVWTGGLATSRGRMLPEGLLDPIAPLLIHPEVLDESGWFDGGVSFMDIEQRQYMVAMTGNAQNAPWYYNTERVDPNEIQSYWDVLEPKWRGRIGSVDPRLNVVGNSLPFYLGTEELGEEYLRRMITEMDLQIFADGRQMAEALALGRIDIVWQSGGVGDFRELKGQGLPVEDQFPHPMREGARIQSGDGALFAVNRAPNTAAQKLFVNWILTRQGQIYWQRLSGNNSLRVDIPKDDVDPGNRIDPDATYVWEEKHPGDFPTVPEAQEVVRQIMADAGIGQ